MRILVDENIPIMTVHALREMGHEVRDIYFSYIQIIECFTQSVVYIYG